MAETLSLMEFLQALLTDAELRGSFAHDPQGTLAVHGLADLTPDDVHDALVLVQDNQTVDYSLDLSGTPAPPPPPPAGDGHEAAVEYLARYLAGPQQAAADESWPTVDPDAEAPPATHAPAGLPDGSFGAGFDDEYGAGTTAAASADHRAHFAEPSGLAGGHGAGGHETGFDLGDQVDLGGLDDLGGFDDLDGFADHDGADHAAPAPDPGTDSA